MGQKKRESLKTSYYRSFLILIVVPILLITLYSIVVIRAMIRDRAIQNVQRAQENIVSALTKEIKDVSLRLSHMVYVNDNEIIKLAVKTDVKDFAERHDRMGKLTESFNYAMVPVQDIRATIFLMKSGRSTYMKDDTVIPRKELETSSWYREAMADKNNIKMGFYDTNVTTSRQSANPFTLVAALSPGIGVDRDEKVEMVFLAMSSGVGKTILEYNRERLLGGTMILGKEGNVLFDPGANASLLPRRYYEAGADQSPERWNLPEKDVFVAREHGKKFVYITHREPESGSRIVSVIRESELTRDFNQAAAIVVGVTLILFFLFYYFTNYFLRNILNPVHQMVEGMKRVEEGHLDTYLEPSGQVEIRTMVNSFNHMVCRIGNLINENKEQQEKKHEAELRALQSQINPHFLVNSLNSIRFMAQVAKFEGIRKMAEALIKILSTSFRSNAGFYTVREELQVLESFVYLMKIRYSDGFEMEYQVEEECLEYQVPRLILQPIVENSIVHGFNELREDIGRIELSIVRQENRLVITVWDNGSGVGAETIKQLMEGRNLESTDHTSIGVSNVISRLKLNYKEQCKLEMESEPGQFTRTRLELPIVVTQKEEGEHETSFAGR